MTARFLVLDSVTTLDAQARGAVSIAASHGGVIAAHMALAGGIVAVLLNDAGVGLDAAGIGGLAWCDGFGVPCATIDHASARIGDGADCAARGIVSHVNVAARKLGVQPGAHRPLVLIDSVSLTEPSDAGAVVFTGSHGGLQGNRPESAIVVAAFAALYNDAGIGIDEAGISRLPALDARGIAGATVSCMSARIGDARSAFGTGVLSRVNRTAAAHGAQPGMTARAFAALMCGTAG